MARDLDIEQWHNPAIRLRLLRGKLEIGPRGNCHTRFASGAGNWLAGRHAAAVCSEGSWVQVFPTRVGGTNNLPCLPKVLIAPDLGPLRGHHNITCLSNACLLLPTCGNRLAVLVPVAPHGKMVLHCNHSPAKLLHLTSHCACAHVSSAPV